MARKRAVDKTAARAVARIVVEVDKRMASWRALNHQVQWAIDDNLLSVLAEPKPGQPYDVTVLRDLRFTMQALGRWPMATYWQQFWTATDADRHAAIRRAAKVLGLEARA